MPGRGCSRTFTVWLALDGALGQQRSFFRISSAHKRIRACAIRTSGRSGASAVARSHAQPAAFGPFLVLFANLVDKARTGCNPSVRQSEIRVKLDSLFKHLQP